MIILSVDDRRVAVLRVALDPLPDAEHRAAGRVHERAAEAAQRREVSGRDSEGWYDDHVLGVEPAEIEATVRPRHQELDPHLLHPAVHVGIVDDLTDEEKAAVGELVARFVGVLDGPVHPVAVAELLGQSDRHVTDGGPESALAEPVHHLRVVLLLEDG